MLMITAFVFLTVNVFAETDFGYTTTVSNQDTINGVVITLKANRGSLINSGTAALGYSGYCPVLVTVTLQNTNNQNVLINNLKFKVTTNSSGNFSRIVSFEQLSHDLIVAETPYDLNNYISIVPSNEYSYGTGIVVPANSSMYMVCLMNVYANYDTASNQWQVPSLQYIGYDQSITVTKGDYHSTGVPVDLTQISDALSNLINTVSTSSELQQLITVMTYSGNDPSVSASGGNSRYISVTSYDSLNGFVWMRHSPYIVSTYDYEYNNTTDNAVAVGTKRVYFEYLLCLFTAVPVGTRYYHEYNILPNLTNISINVTEFYSDIYTAYDTYYGRLDLYLKHNATTTNTGYVPYGRNYTVIRGYYETDLNTNIPITSNGLDMQNICNNIFSLDPNGYYPKDEFSILRDLYLAYSQVNGLDDSSDLSNDVADVSDSNHIIEESYYSANASAIEATGLSNYHFSNEQNNGIGSVANDFMLLWNSLGSWNGVYIFSLTMALATFIMRHRGMLPSKSKGDKGGDE